MHNNEMLKVNLQLFGEGASAGEGTGSVASTEGATLSKADNSGSSRRNSGAPKVVYGKQADVSETETTIPAAEGTSEGNGITTTSNTLEDRKKAFDDLINGEYKDLFTEKTQGIINNRFKETKAVEKALADQKPLMDMLRQRYGVDGDVNALIKAFEEDTHFWESAAEEKGMTVEQYKAMQKLERENAELLAERKRKAGQAQAQAQIDTWYREAEEVKKTYPSFDFKAEVQNRDFLGLLRKGISVQQAYELVHRDEIQGAIAKSAANAAGEQMAARIKAKSSRPSENGMSSQSAAVIKKDSASSLTRRDRAEIAKLVQRGERITF